MSSAGVYIETVTRPLAVGQPLNFRLPITIALENAYALLTTAESTDPANAHSPVTQALILCEAVCAEISKPLSPLRPTPEDFKEVRQLKSICHARLIAVLASEDYLGYKSDIHQQLTEVLRVSGRRTLTHCKPEFGRMFDSVRGVIQNSGWPLWKQVVEFNELAQCVPEEEAYWGIKFWFELSICRQMMQYLQRCITNHPIEEVRDAVISLRALGDRFQETALSAPSKGDVFPAPRWETSDYYTSGGQKLAAEYEKLWNNVEIRFLLSQGNKLLDVITARTKRIEPEYFRFQALLAFDSYRSAYQLCQKLEEIDVELEGKCLWCLGRVLGGYLGLENQAYEAYFAAVSMVGMTCSLSPDEEWYRDAAEQVQAHRRRREEEGRIGKVSRVAGVMSELFFELLELQNRSERVKDERSLREFFHWLVRTHPPRYVTSEGTTGGLLECRELSKVVLNVIGAYDRSRSQEIGVIWEVLCDEIIKVYYSKSHLTIDC